MKKYLILFCFLAPACALSYSYPWVSFVLLIFCGLAMIALAAGYVSRAFWKKISRKWVQVPWRVLAVCAIALAVGLMRPLEPAVIHSTDESEMLAYAYKTDQADRFALKPYLGFVADNLALRDHQRRELVSQLYEQQKIVSPTQKFHAAFIFHHSKMSAHHELAYRLAMAAASAQELKNEYVVQWLAKASYDRWMVSLGKPQKYGTQNKFSLSVE